MHITLLDTNPNIRDAWSEYFPGMENISISGEDFRDMKADAIVSPANSFGFMDGGIDLAYSLHFGWEVQTRLQNSIASFNEDIVELFVGQALCIETVNNSIPHLIFAPTMRVPQVINDSVDVYLATRAALLLTKRLGFKSIIIPGMGTGVGQVNPNVAAKRMRMAYDEVFSDEVKVFSSWRGSYDYHYMI